MVWKAEFLTTPAEPLSKIHLTLLLYHTIIIIIFSKILFSFSLIAKLDHTIFLINHEISSSSIESVGSLCPGFFAQISSSPIEN